MKKEYYEKHKEEILAKSKAYNKTEKGKEASNRAKKKYAEKNKEKVKEQHKKYRNSDKGKKTLAEVAKRFRDTSIRGKANQLYHSMKRNSKARGHAWDDTWWSIDKIYDIISNSKCSKTGLSFVYTESKLKNKNPFSPSPDRIDNTKGYEPSNVQWVVLIYNMMKHCYTKEQVDIFITALKENHD